MEKGEKDRSERGRGMREKKNIEKQRKVVEKSVRKQDREKSEIIGKQEKNVGEKEK